MKPLLAPNFLKKYIALTPFLTFVGFFLLWPIATVVIKSFRDRHENWTLENFKPIFQGTYFHSFIISIKLSLVTATLSSIVGAFFVFTLINYGSHSLNSFVDSISSVFANSGGVPLAFMFISAFGMEGLITKSLQKLGIDLYKGNFTLFSFTGVCFVYLFFLVPLMVIVFKPAVENIKNEWHEASQSLGGSEFTYLRRVLFPILLPPFLGGFFLLFAGAFSAYATARAMTSGTVPLVPILIGNLVDGNVISNEANLGDALALGMILVAVIAMFGYWLSQSKVNKWKN